MKKLLQLLLGMTIAIPMSAQVNGQGDVLQSVATDGHYDVVEVQAVEQRMEVMPTRIARLGMSPKPMVATYKSLVRAIGDGGSQVRVATDGDSLIIADLVLANAVVKAGIDNGKLSIPNWYSVGRIEGVGNIAFVALKMVDNTVVVDTTATAITGTIADDETIALDGMFGLFTTEQEAASYYYVGKECVIQKGNATMTMNYYGTDVKYAIIARQHDGVMTITNFGNTGLTFDAPLTTDREIAIGGKTFAKVKPAASVLDFMVMGVSRYKTNDDGTITPIIYNSLLKTVADGDRAVTWGLWCGTNSSGAYVVGPYMSGRIDFTEDVAYPTAPDLTGMEGTGTADDPFIIATTADWLTVADNVKAGNTHVGHFFKLTNDLDFSGMTFVPIGEATGMRGTIDGQKHTVTVNDAVATSPRGLIGRLGDEGVVRNLNAAGSFDFGAVTNCGGIVGLTGNNALIENCTNYANITTAGLGVGGVLGHGNSGTVVRNCKNLGTIHYMGDNGSSWVAGVVGYALGMSLYDCGNEGAFTIDNPTSAGCIAGVVSYTHYMDELSGCYNTADITAGQYISGVQAYCAQTGLGWVVYKGCYNTGNITSTITSTNIPLGGICTNVVAGAQFVDCWNSGAITTVGCNSAGGIAGRYVGSTADTIERAMTFKRCYNTGDITATATANMTLGGVMGFGNVVLIDSCWNSGAISNTQYISGGIIGQIQNRSALSAITSSYNLGSVTGGNWVGGIAGNAAIDRPIDNCWNAGTITAKNRAGGIVGYSAYGSKISRCFNVGDVVSTLTAAGTGNNASHSIGGIAGHYAGYITDSYNAGQLEGKSRVGGIMGAPYRNAAQDNPNHVHHLDGCYNVGEMQSALPDSLGHIVGVHMRDNGSVWREHGYILGDTLAQAVDTLENCFYLNSINTDAISEPEVHQTGCTAAELCQTQVSGSFSSPGDYCYPILTSQKENPYALLYAAAVVPAEVDAQTGIITTDFHVGAPASVTWTSSYDGLTISGTEASFTSDAFEGDITLTATIALPWQSVAGYTKAEASSQNNVKPLKRDIIVRVNKPMTTAIDDIITSKVGQPAEYYNLQGMRVVHPESYHGILICITPGSDGTRTGKTLVK
ncbi:MAG: hypothetical protein IJK21_03725 [Prevotella sp.]|nr:hypothetical protein [Prevotella sp.]